MINWFYSLTRGRQICVGTIAAHLFILLALTVQHFISFPVNKKRRPIAVNTVRVCSPAPKVVLPPAPTVKAVKPIAKPVAPVKAPVATAKPNKPKEIKKAVVAKPELKKAATPSQVALLKEIENTIAAIETPVIHKKTEVEVPQYVEREEVFEAVVVAPSLQISAFLQEMLKLPEIGQVRVQLSIDPMGKLKTFEVLDSKSEKNAAFLRKQLPDLQFPCFNETVSLTIVFSNEL